MKTPAFAIWLGTVIILTGLCGTIYVTVQQVLRQSANDPQIQIAEDATARLNSGAAPQSVVPTTIVDMTKSLATLVNVYDTNGTLIAGSGQINGIVPTPPKGMLDAAQGGGQNRVTWQPTSTVRQAAVVVPYNNGFVVASRSLTEVENRETQTNDFVMAAWVASLFVATITFLAVSRSKYL